MKHSYKIAIAIWHLLLFFISGTTAQSIDGNFPPPENPPEIIAQRTNSIIVVDGKLEESDWANASIVSDFFKREPRQGEAIRYETAVRFLYDDKNLYIGAFCKDSVGLKGIRVQDLRRDFEWGKMIFSG